MLLAPPRGAQPMMGQPAQRMPVPMPQQGMAGMAGQMGAQGPQLPQNPAMAAQAAQAQVLRSPVGGGMQPGMPVGRTMMR